MKPAWSLPSEESSESSEPGEESSERGVYSPVLLVVHPGSEDSSRTRGSEDSSRTDRPSPHVYAFNADPNDVSTSVLTMLHRFWLEAHPLPCLPAAQDTVLCVSRIEYL